MSCESIGSVRNEWQLTRRTIYAYVRTGRPVAAILVVSVAAMLIALWKLMVQDQECPHFHLGVFGPWYVASGMLAMISCDGRVRIGIWYFGAATVQNQVDPFMHLVSSHCCMR